MTDVAGSSGSGGSLGLRYVEALAAKDRSALLDLLAPDLRLRGLTPGRFWEAESAEGFLEVALGAWFEESDVIEAVEHVETADLPPRSRVSYRLRVTNPDGTFRVEQHAYVDVRGGRITGLQVICSGYQPWTDPA